MESRLPPRLARLSRAGWPRSFPVAQFPNPPLIVALLAWVIARVTDGRARDAAEGVFLVGLTVWAWEELSRGVNWFRRALGALGLAYVVVRIAAALGD